MVNQAGSSQLRRDDPTLAVASDPARRAKYRRLQSWYRETRLTAPFGEANGRPVGSLLHPDWIAAHPNANFLGDDAFDHAQLRASEVKAEGGSLEPIRLHHNMLSSMPLCFNLFGALGPKPAFLEVVRTCFAPDAARIIGVTCEYAPQPPSAFLADRSAFDAIINFEREDGSIGFVGIETKYTEPFSATAYQSDRYNAVTTSSGWFVGTDASTTPSELATNQLWRTVPLAAALELDGRTRSGGVVVVCTADDNTAASTVTKVRGQYPTPSGFGSSRSTRSATQRRPPATRPCRRGPRRSRPATST